MATSSSSKRKADNYADGNPEIEEASQDEKRKRRRAPCQFGRKGPDIEMFQYQPLDNPAEQIRLLSIHTGAVDSPMTCELKTYSRSAEPLYHAISYAWGEAWPTSVIFVNGQIVMVRQNCLYALAQARLHLEKDCLVWIDAICIDQQNLYEKSCQVMAMGDIFASAICVFACIGPTTGSATYMFDTAEEIEYLKCYDSDDCNFCMQNADSESTGLDKYHLHHVHTWLDTIEHSQFAELAKAFDDFGKNEYWQRLWVIQEITLASDVRVLCGQRGINLLALVMIQTVFKEITYSPSSALNQVALVKGLNQSDFLGDRIKSNSFSTMCDYRWWCGDLDLGDHLHTLREWKCDDPRDRIFGLLRLIKWPRDQGPPTPDYCVQPIELAINVLKRLGRGWSFLYQVVWLLEAVGVRLDQAAKQKSIRQSNRLNDTINTATFNGVTSGICTCIQFLNPRITMRLNMDRCAVIHLGYSDTLLATPRPGINIHQHVQLGFYHADEGDFITVTAKFGNATVPTFFSTSPVRAGDLLLEIQDFPDSRDHGDPLFGTDSYFILRQARRCLFEIVGQVEIHGFTGICTDGWQCCSLNDVYPSPQVTNKRFTVCFDAEDAVTYVLSGRKDRGEGSFRNCDPLGSEPRRAINRRFGRTRFSSFVLRSEATPERVEADPYLINSIPSIGDPSTICANCGGFFDAASSKARNG